MNIDLKLGSADEKLRAVPGPDQVSITFSEEMVAIRSRSKGCVKNRLKVLNVNSNVIKIQKAAPVALRLAA